MAVKIGRNVDAESENQSDSDRENAPRIQHAAGQKLQSTDHDVARRINQHRAYHRSGHRRQHRRQLRNERQRDHINPAGSAINRLVVPVASDNPTLLDTVFCATPPVKPENSVPSPLAKMPPLMDLMSVRFQSASLIFWQSVMSPTVFKLAVKQAITNGATSERRNERPETTRCGRLS